MSYSLAIWPFIKIEKIQIEVIKMLQIMSSLMPIHLFAMT